MAMMCHCQTLVPLSWPQNQEMAPTTQHDVSGEGGGVDVGRLTVKQKGDSWGFTGNSKICPLKPMQWLQRAE
eukprot:7033411-Ditylum_brightwellii.AAC.1